MKKAADPMNNWQIDILKDQNDTAAWNELNAPDPAENAMKAAAKKLDESAEHLFTGGILIMSAARAVEGLPMEDRILSFIESIDNIRMDLKALAEKYKRGERD